MATRSLDIKKGFGIIHLNVLSLTKHKDEICAELLGYDILGLTETWLTPKVIDRLVDIDGYTLLRQDRITKTSSGKVKKCVCVCVCMCDQSYCPISQ